MLQYHITTYHHSNMFRMWGYQQCTWWHPMIRSSFFLWSNGQMAWLGVNLSVLDKDDTAKYQFLGLLLAWKYACYFLLSPVLLTYHPYISLISKGLSPICRWLTGGGGPPKPGKSAEASVSKHLEQQTGRHGGTTWEKHVKTWENAVDPYFLKIVHDHNCWWCLMTF